jgi:hypothetical protein
MPFDSGGGPVIPLNPTFESVTISQDSGLLMDQQTDPLFAQIFTSVDGVNWILRTTPFLPFVGNGAYIGLGFSPTLGTNGRLVCTAVNGGTNPIIYSDDGINWNYTTIPANFPPNCFAWSPSLGIFVAVGTGTNRSYTSPDGINWTLHTGSGTLTYISCEWSEPLGLFVAVANNGVVNSIQTSPDGITWTPQTTNANQWRDVCWSDRDAQFVAISSNPSLTATSPDGVTWTEHAIAGGFQWQGICFSPDLGIYVAVCNQGGGGAARAATSPDGIVWTIHTLPGNIDDWARVQWSPIIQLFAACSSGTGNDNRIMTSPDGAVWTFYVPADGHQLEDIIWAPGLNLFVSCALQKTGFTFTGTLTNAPAAGNPGFWAPIIINGVKRHFPTW